MSDQSQVPPSSYQPWGQPQWGPPSPLERIAADVATIKAWVTFFGVLTCASMGLMLLGMLAAAAG